MSHFSPQDRNCPHIVVFVDGMRRWGASLVCILTCLGLSRAATATVADTASNPYQPVVRRNLFGLLSVPVAQNQPLPAPTARIRLTGTTSILGARVALLMVQLPAAGSEPADELSLILKEGQTEGQIKVLEINEEAGSVTVENYGTIQVLTF